MTNKSILVVDTPTCCAECDLYDYNVGDGYAICYPDYIRKDMFAETQDFNPFTMHMPECPLVTIEDAIEIIVKEYEDAKNN